MPRPIVIDITISDTNVGNRVIMEGAIQAIKHIWPETSLVRIPFRDVLSRTTRNLVRGADIALLCGGNVLTTRPWLCRPWPGSWCDTASLRGKVVTLGVSFVRWRALARLCDDMGWLARILYGSVLSPAYFHSVRSAHAATVLTRNGWNALVTGCPSMWALHETHVRAIRTEKGNRALCTLTFYAANLERDAALLRALKSEYDVVYFWPQQPQDLVYFSGLPSECRNGVQVLREGLEEFDSFLETHCDADYVGTRLHAGIRALQRRRRAVIIAVDERAREMASFGLPVVEVESYRDMVQALRRPMIVETGRRLPWRNIELWKNQFIA